MRTQSYHQDIPRRRPLVLLLALAAVAMLCAPGVAAADPGRRGPELEGVGPLLDELVPAQLAEGQIPGAVVTVVAAGETVFSSGYGEADPHAHTAMDPDRTGVYTGSIAKLFTATAVLQLVEQGELDLHADVNQYLTDLEIPETYPGHPVTLHHLLTYSAGFDDDVYGWSQWDRQELPSLAEFTAHELPSRVRPPGELVAYNNFDYVLAGRLVQIASGQDFSEYVAEHVLEPAGMTHTSVGQPHPTDEVTTVAPGYRPTEDGQTRAGAQLSPATPAGPDVLTTGADMGRFMIAQLEADSPLGADVPSVMQQEQFSAHPDLPGMGYAWEQRSMHGQQVVTKDGDQPGTHHNMALLPQHGLGIHVAYTGDGTDQAAFWGGEELVRAVVAEAFEVGDGASPGDSTPPGDAAAATSGQEASEAVAGTYRSARTSHANFTKVSSLTAPVTVEAVGPGRITTVGLSHDPDVTAQTWVATAPDRFVLEGGGAELGVTGSGDLVTTQMPSSSFEPLPWYQSPALHLAVLAVSAAVLLAAFVVLPVRLVVGRRGGRVTSPAGTPPVGARIAQVLAWIAGLCTVVFAVGFVIVTADANLLAQIPLTGSPALSIALNTMSVLALVAPAMLVLAILAWVRGWWSPRGRVLYGVVTASACAFVAVAVFYRLIGVPLTLTV
ncbi:serine hydrolase [Brachybacterium fresconis]|uniref:CubicO group peptidase (Beta-lactamase class C family) n=1 Tax=Brachybacterium fresconis TaxID=173363 RepID=A0ABS4YNM3_9MICO|nr:CubicO group peptidase (beta-lactamase class C family) [Brachybacterium fresconis]